jgi:hypothetical protein
MATVKVKITAPLPNTVANRAIQITGTVSVEDSSDEIVQLSGVSIKFGDTGPSFSATRVGTSWANWKATRNAPAGVIGGSTLKITAWAFGQESPRPPATPDWEDFTSQEVSVSVVLEATPPVVTIDPYTPEVTPPSLPYRLTLSGSARDEGAAVKEVRWRLNSASFAPVDNLQGNWLRWQKVIDLPAGEHLITIQAVDTLENKSFKDAPISVRRQFQPSNAELAFAPVTYLQELMSFAERWIKIGSTGVGPKAQDLANRFFQPFDRLTQANLYELSTRELHQTRIAVEVLRRRLRQINQPVPRAVEQNFRRVAYEALLLQIGTSHEELRAARIADDATRRALAERLGFWVESARPDRLDRITLPPDQVTEAQLEQLFGFEATTNDDPLRTMSAAAEILNWRLAATRDRWTLEDAQARDGADGSIPIIDPDLVGEANLLTLTAGNRVYDLWKARKTWLDAKLAEAEGQREQGFEHIIRTFIGNLDFAALTTQDANGVDISPVLDPLNLELSAFRFLGKCRELAAAGALLETEWRDILDIVVQVQKKRQYQQWRVEESGLSLAPQYFRLPDEQGSGPTASPWRARWPVYAAWRKTLAVRIGQLQGMKDAYQSALDAAEARTLPVLRDSLIEIIGRRQTPPENVAVAAERLTRELVIDLRANAGQKTTRVNQAIETLLGAIFSVRAGRLAMESAAWEIEEEPKFDLEWQWMAAYRTWRAAMTVFAYPESQLYPNLFIKEDPFLNPTKAFLGLIAALRDTARMTPALAREKAQEYLDKLRTEPEISLPEELKATHAEPFVITAELDDLNARKVLVRTLFENAHVTEAHDETKPLLEVFREVFWLVPVVLALQLQRAGYYLTALDWFQTVYAFNLPPTSRKIYHELELEGRITSEYARVDEWLVEELNSHIFARKRKNAYTRFTVLSIARCFLDYADAEFSQSTAESVGRARTLYETAEDLLNLLDMKPETGASIPFLPNPVWESLRLHARANLSKIHNGLNIAGMPFATPVLSDASTSLPSQYRYAALVERAKQLVGIAQQVESAFLAAMERRDAEAYSLMQAGHDLRVAGATVSLQDLKITDADLTVQMAELQQEKAQIQVDYFDEQLREGLNSWEKTALASMGTAIYLQTSASVAYSIGSVVDTVKSIFTFGLFGDSAGKIGQALSALSDAASLTGGLAQTMASFERREQEWRLQKSLSDKDVQISGQQILLALNQRQMALMERELAGLQLDHATAVVDFLVNKFTNAELYEWMSGVLGRVYSYFLQQATAMAKLAQSQLAFERQEPALSVVQSDYWQVTAEGFSDGGTDGAAPDRRGLTGSARLLQDIYQLDQYAFETRQRKLQLIQTLSLAQLVPLELQRFRETGDLIFVTPMEMFDRDFPGHYLRLIRRVRVSVIALVPPTRGLRATLSASGISRVVTGGDTFETIQVRRFGETVAFTSPLNATGLFELEPEGELLLPFEGMGVDTSWDLQLPKAANPFDYRAIADVLLTIEYTALSSPVYRQQVIKQLDRSISGDRMFSFREQFADSWYELNNADALEDVGRRMVANFSTRREDFPPHIEDLRIQHVTLHVARQDGFVEEINIAGLKFTPEGETTPVGGAARTVEAVVSTRRPNGSAWLGMQGKAPVGGWELRFPNTAQIRAWFKEGLIEDLALVVTFGGTTPAWSM